MKELNFNVEMKEGYLGGIAWTGCNYNGYMNYGEINKIVKKAFNTKYKDAGVFYKISCTGKSFSGGQECNGTLTMNLNDAIYSFDEVIENKNKYFNKNHCCFSPTRYLNMWDCDVYNTPYEEQLKVLYNKYVKRLTSYGELINKCDELDELILKPLAVNMVNDLNAMYDSFNDYDVNSMVDYFDVMFYKDVKLRVVENA